MVDHQILGVTLGLGERVVAGAVLAVLGAGLEHRHRALGPALRIHEVAATVGGQQAHRIRHAGAGRGVRDEDLVVVEQERRTFVDEEVDALPVILGLGEHHRISGQRPRVRHRGDVQVGVAGDVVVLLRPDEVLHAVDHLGGRVERERVHRRDDLALLDPVVGGRVGIGVLQHEHAVGGHAVRLELVFRAGEVDVPRAVHAVQLRSPDVLAAYAGLMLAPDHGLRGLLQVVDRRGVTDGNLVVLGIGCGEPVFAVDLKHPRIRTLEHDRIVVNSHCFFPSPIQVAQYLHRCNIADVQRCNNSAFPAPANAHSTQPNHPSHPPQRTYSRFHPHRPHHPHYPHRITTL